MTRKPRLGRRVLMYTTDQDSYFELIDVAPKSLRMAVIFHPKFTDLTGQVYLTVRDNWNVSGGVQECSERASTTARRLDIKERAVQKHLSILNKFNFIEIS